MAYGCYGKMVRILKYPVGGEPPNSICSCNYRKSCLEITRKYATKISMLPGWVKSIRKEEIHKIQETKTVCIYLLKGIPDTFVIDYPERIPNFEQQINGTMKNIGSFFDKHPDTAIVLCSVW